jgi:hypothetical protein
MDASLVLFLNGTNSWKIFLMLKQGGWTTIGSHATPPAARHVVLSVRPPPICRLCLQPTTSGVAHPLAPLTVETVPPSSCRTVVHRSSSLPNLFLPSVMSPPPQLGATATVVTRSSVAARPAHDQEQVRPHATGSHARHYARPSPHRVIGGNRHEELDLFRFGP